MTLRFSIFSGVFCARIATLYHSENRAMLDVGSWCGSASHLKFTGQILKYIFNLMYSNWHLEGPRHLLEFNMRALQKREIPPQ